MTIQTEVDSGSPAAPFSRAARSPSASRFAGLPTGAFAQGRGGRARARPQGGRRLSRRQWRRHGDGVVRQGRSRPGPAHRHAADRRRGTRHRARQDQIYRGRHRADARPGPHRRLLRHCARRHAVAPGGGDGAQGADRAGGANGSTRRPTISSPSTARCGARAAAPGVSFASLVGGKQIRPQARPQGAAQGSGHLHAGRQAAAAARHASQVHRQPHLSCRISACPACCTDA